MKCTLVPQVYVSYAYVFVLRGGVNRHVCVLASSGGGCQAYVVLSLCFVNLAPSLCPSPPVVPCYDILPRGNRTSRPQRPKIPGYRKSILRRDPHSPRPPYRRLKENLVRRISSATPLRRSRAKVAAAAVTAVTAVAGEGAGSPYPWRDRCRSRARLHPALPRPPCRLSARSPRRQALLAAGSTMTLLLPPPLRPPRLVPVLGPVLRPVLRPVLVPVPRRTTCRMPV